MNIEEVREYCLSLHLKVEECSPFADLGHLDVAFTIAGKIFAYLCVPEGPSCIHNDEAELVVPKCNPEKAIELREAFPGLVEPAWHWNKKYWNQVRYAQLPHEKLQELIFHSFNEVIQKLPKKLRTELASKKCV